MPRTFVPKILISFELAWKSVSFSCPFCLLCFRVQHAEHGTEHKAGASPAERTLPAQPSHQLASFLACDLLLAPWLSFQIGLLHLCGIFMMTACQKHLIFLFYVTNAQFTRNLSNDGIKHIFADDDHRLKYRYTSQS